MRTSDSLTAAKYCERSAARRDAIHFKEMVRRTANGRSVAFRSAKEALVLEAYDGNSATFAERKATLNANSREHRLSAVWFALGIC